MSPDGDKSDAMDIVFGGEEGSLTFEVSPEGRVDRALLAVGPLVGELATDLGLDLPRMRDELAAALSSRRLTGGTSLQSVEHDLLVRVEITHGKGTVQGSVTTQFKSDGGLRFVLTTDQSYLRETLRQIEATLASGDS
jgi:hypothetical protein